MNQLSLLAFVFLVGSCKHNVASGSKTTGIVESSPKTPAEFNKPWEIAKSGIEYWWADEQKVFAITCNPKLDSPADNQVGFSSVEDCKRSYLDSVRSMPIKDFKAKTLKFISDQSEVSNRFKWRRIIDKYKERSLDSHSDQSEVTSLSEALRMEKSHKVTSIGDPELFIDDLIERLRRNPSSGIEDARDPEVSKGYDKFMRKLLLKVTVGRYIPDAALSKGYQGMCKTRKTVPDWDLPSHVTRGAFYHPERDFTFLLVGPDDTCSRYGFQTAEYRTAKNDELARQLIYRFAANTEIPEAQDVSKVFGGGKLVKMNDFEKAGFAAFRVAGEKLDYLSQFHKSLPASYRATNTLCQREELQFINWNPCP